MNRVEIAMKEFDICLRNWIDLPKYVYTQEYRYAFEKFMNEQLKSRTDTSETGIKLFVSLTLDHETDINKIPYFTFNRI